MLDAVQYIESFTEHKTKAVLDEEPLVRFAVKRQLEIIGEAATHISDELKATAGHVEWREIKAFRNIVAHQYFGIDYDIVWTIIQEKIPVLKEAIIRLIRDTK